MSDSHEKDQSDAQTRRAAVSARAAQDDARAVPAVTAADLRALAQALHGLNWGDGLSRDQLRRKVKPLPEGIYLRLPATKKYTAAAQVLHDIGDAASRAEGDFLGANPDIPDAASVGDGGPPAWGADPIFTPHAVEDGGSAEDTEGLEQDEEDGAGH